MKEKRQGESREEKRKEGGNKEGKMEERNKGLAPNSTKRNFLIQCHIENHKLRKQ